MGREKGTEKEGSAANLPQRAVEVELCINSVPYSFFFVLSYTCNEAPHVGLKGTRLASDKAREREKSRGEDCE